MLLAAETDATPPGERRPGESLRALLVVLFVLYLALLVWVVLWKLEAPYLGGGALRRIKLVPFLPSDEDGASAPGEVLANVLLFVPFGVYLRLLAPSWPWWRIAGAAAGASLILETAQYVMAVGSFDVTDLIVNTAGGAVGIALLALLHRSLPGGRAAVMICVVGTALALSACVLFAASPLHLGQRDPVPPAGLRLGWQFHGDAEPSGGQRREGESSPVRVDDALDDRQPESDTGVIAADAFGAALKRLGER